jgi:hypothetical protein
MSRSALLLATPHEPPATALRVFWLWWIVTTFTPIRATGSHFYRYQSADHLDRLKTILLEHALYLPSVAQLNDPTDC